MAFSGLRVYGLPMVEATTHRLPGAGGIVVLRAVHCSQIHACGTPTNGHHVRHCHGNVYVNHVVLTAMAAEQR